jgi:YVTN family beta-propeller protein
MVGLAGNVAPCHRTNDWGSCSGTMVCLGGGMGWTQCTAKMPDAESCNDLDDDCNGLTDDGFADSDGDGDADCIDVDTDNDGVPDETDNCIFLNNPEQADYDQDLNGDECDGDDDNDWWPDYYDCEPLDKTSFPGAEEVQDGKDNNCNDQIDETDQTGGNCGLGCFQEGAGPGQGQAFDLDKEGVSGLETDDKGYLKLGVGSLKFPSIWISNSGEGTVSKLDTETGKEEGRYKVCSDPSRTAVDLLGDVWVACRGDGGVAKIILFDANCTDKDGDGTVETSTDNNGDGKIQGAEMLPQGQDECIKFIAYPGGSCQRAAGVDKENFAWIGEWNESKLRRLHPDNGAVVQTVELQGVNPYGLVIDGDGIVWISGRGGNKLLRVDPLTNQVKQYAPPNAGWGFEPYGISLDAKGRIWIASCCMEAKVYRFDPAVEQFSEVTTQSSPRGVVGHLNGNVYVANDSSDNVAVIVADTLQVAANVDLGYGRFPVGMSVDIDGNVWAVNQNGNSATKIDVLTNQVIGEYPVGLYPYTYSDMTGYLLYTYTSPSGYYYETFCANTESPVQWVLLNADLAWPEGTLAAVRLRSAASAELLQEKAWLSPFDKFPPETFPKELGAVAGLDDKCLEVEFLLSPNEDGASPLLKKIVVQYQVEL